MSEFSELSVRQLTARRHRLANGVSAPERTLHGSLLREGRQCSSERCRCRRGELHGPYAYLSVYLDGRSRTLYVPATLAEVTESYLQDTQRDEELLRQISLINLELLRRRALE
jgi:hypothetical protein